MNKPLCVFRVDSSLQIGTGHVVRTLVLAEVLRKKGCSILFITRVDEGNVVSMIREEGYPVEQLPSASPFNEEDDFIETQKIISKQSQKPDWVIVDHYGISITWEKKTRDFSSNILVMDDLENRQHDCDVLLDPNLKKDFHLAYTSLIPARCHKLIGPTFALLKKEFKEERQKLKKNFEGIKNVLVFFGGIDKNFDAKNAIIALKDLSYLNINIVIGKSNPHLEEIKNYQKIAPHIKIHFNPPSLSKLMAAADIYVGGGGSVTWERCCLGLPSIVIAVATNQKATAELMAAKEYIYYLGSAESVSSFKIRKTFDDLVMNPQKCESLSIRSSELVDGDGAERVACIVVPALIEFRRVELKDCQDVYDWRNSPEVRDNSFNSEKTDYEDHRVWFEKSLLNEKRIILIAQINGKPVGILRYDLEPDFAFTALYMAPGNHGKGYATHMFIRGGRWLKKNYPHIQYMLSRVLVKNIASQKALLKSGYTYKFFEKNNEECVMIKNI